jgi:hypothetical protein
LRQKHNLANKQKENRRKLIGIGLNSDYFFGDCLALHASNANKLGSKKKFSSFFLGAS